MNDDELAERLGVSTHYGFPNAATDKSLSSLDLGKLLVRSPISTFFMRVRGHTGEAYGVFDGDIVVVDRSLQPRNIDRIIWWHEESFGIGMSSQVPSNVAPWGVVTYVIHELRHVA